MSSLPTRPLGATGEDVSILGMGGGHVAGANPDDREVVRVIQHAIEQGVTFMDNAWEYSDGRSERLMGEAIQGRRDELFNYATDPELVFAADGAAEAADRALADGKVRLVGTTGHKEPGYLMAMLEHEFPWSTVQMPVTVLDLHYKSFIATVLPEAQRRSIGVIGMKALGGNAGFLTGAGLSLAECLGFALSQPISVLVSGMTTVDEVDQNTAVARDFAPMSPEEQAALQARVRPLAADGRFEKYKSTQAFDSPPHRAQHGFALAESVVAVNPADR